MVQSKSKQMCNVIILHKQLLLDKHTDTIFTLFFSIDDKMFLNPSDIIVVGAGKVILLL